MICVTCKRRPVSLAGKRTYCAVCMWKGRRRLKMIKVCAVCNVNYRPTHKAQITCSHSCSAIRQARIDPENSRAMIAARKKNLAEFKAKRIAQLAHLTPIEAYNLGRKDCYSQYYQRDRRMERSVA